MQHIAVFRTGNYLEYGQSILKRWILRVISNRGLVTLPTIIIIIRPCCQGLCPVSGYLAMRSYSYYGNGHHRWNTQLRDSHSDKVNPGLILQKRAAKLHPFHNCSRTQKLPCERISTLNYFSKFIETIRMRSSKRGLIENANWRATLQRPIYHQSGVWGNYILVHLQRNWRIRVCVYSANSNSVP